jgi:hypothetical protein
MKNVWRLKPELSCPIRHEYQQISRFAWVKKVDH